MAVYETLCYVGTLFLLSSSAGEDTPQCCEFNFETSEITNGVLCVRETAKVNITFTIRNANFSNGTYCDMKCSNVTFGDIDISKTDSVQEIFLPQCKIVQSCDERPGNNMSCQCLDTPGSYSLTFIADRKHSAPWKWTAKDHVREVIITFNVTYPASVTRLEIVGYNSYIPRYRTVSVVCTWENGNPPSRVIILDRHSNVLAKGNASGDISYTFSNIVCNQAGIIRCEADGSDRNRSTTMLIECPPEFVRISATIPDLNIGQNDDVSFPFRSHNPNVSSCHINKKQNTNGDALFLNCPKAATNESDFIRENKQCLYSVTGDPPDFLLTIHVRNLKRNDGGLWFVNISNAEGSDVLYIQVNIRMGSDLADVQINTTHVYTEIKSNQMFSPFVIGVAVLGVVAVIVIVFLIVFYLKNGKDAYSRLRRKGKRETILYKGLGTNNVEYSQRLSRVYYEIQDSQLDTNPQATARTTPLDVSGLPCNKYLHHVESESRNDIRSKAAGTLQTAHEETGDTISLEESACVNPIKTENPTDNSLSPLDYIEPIQTESQRSTVHILPISDYLYLTETGSNVRVLPKPDYLHLTETGNNVPQNSEYLKLVKTDNETSRLQPKSDYLKLVQGINGKNNEQQKSEYLKIVQTGKETNVMSDKPDYLKLIQTESETNNEPLRSDYNYLQPIQKANETNTTAEISVGLEAVQTGSKTINLPQASDYLQPVQTEGETNI